MIVELSDPPKAWGVYPGGQSGNPGSIFYNNFTNKWVAGEYFRLDMSDEVKTKYKNHLKMTSK